MTVSLPILTVLFSLLTAIPIGIIGKIIVGKIIDFAIKKLEK